MYILSFPVDKSNYIQLALHLAELRFLQKEST
jgi:hypothetical protein